MKTRSTKSPLARPGPLYVAKLPAEEPNVTTVNVLPGAGVKPPIVATLSVPPNEADPDDELVVLAAGRCAADVDGQAADRSLGVVPVDRQGPQYPHLPERPSPEFVTLAIRSSRSVERAAIMATKLPVIVPPFRVIDPPA